MFNILFRKERCKGCELCVNVCPKGIIEMQMQINAKGYYTANISQDKINECIGCSSCAKICPDSVISIERD